jgi:hypothetical protein
MPRCPRVHALYLWVVSTWWSGCRREEVVAQEPPAHWIERHRAELRVLDEDGFLAAVRGIPALADSDSPSWEQEEPWDDAYRLLAAADVIGERGWVKAIVPVFERAARGDLYETMQWLRHGPERAARAGQLAALLEPLTNHPRAGTRQWAVRELGSCGNGPASSHSSTRSPMKTTRCGPRPEDRLRCSPRCILTLSGSCLDRQRRPEAVGASRQAG